MFTCSVTTQRTIGDSFAKHEWHRALRATGVRSRKFYATRHTFISLALSDGRPPQWVAEYVGTSLAMLQKHAITRDVADAVRPAHLDELSHRALQIERWLHLADQIEEHAARGRGLVGVPPAHDRGIERLAGEVAFEVRSKLS